MALDLDLRTCFVEMVNWELQNKIMMQTSKMLPASSITLKLSL